MPTIMLPRIPAQTARAAISALNEERALAITSVLSLFYGIPGCGSLFQLPGCTSEDQLVKLCLGDNASDAAEKQKEYQSSSQPAT